MNSFLRFSVWLALVGCSSAMLPSVAQTSTYRPIPLTGNEVRDTLTDQDIPTGQRGFAKDYVITLDKDDRLEISVASDAFDTIVSLLRDGEVIAENDDAGKETTNSLLFVRIPQRGQYVVRVQSFGGSKGGKFVLRVTKLRPVN